MLSELKTERSTKTKLSLSPVSPSRRHVNVIQNGQTNTLCIVSVSKTRVARRYFSLQGSLRNWSAKSLLPVPSSKASRQFKTCINYLHNRIDSAACSSL